MISDRTDLVERLREDATFVDTLVGGARFNGQPGRASRLAAIRDNLRAAASALTETPDFIIGKGGSIYERICSACQQPYPDYGHSSHMRCYSCRWQAKTPACGCGAKMTQCSGCAVADWQAAHHDCPQCCVPLSTLAETPEPQPSEAERTVRSLAAMLGWMNVPPRETLEMEIRTLKALARQGQAETPEPAREPSQRFHCVMQLRKDSWEYRLKRPGEPNNCDDLVPADDVEASPDLARAPQEVTPSKDRQG